MLNINFIDEYTSYFSYWADFSRRLKILLEDLLKEKNIDFHIIEERAKSVQSVKEKLNRPGKNYKNPINDLPDLAGIRIVLYDKEGVELTAQLIDKEFNVDASSSTNKLNELSPDQFGYLSYHKIIKLKDNRKEMTEWARFSGYHAEIQIRTVLQHAWASVSHKLQYKRESEIPALIRRRLTRLAGLFELADDEFLALRTVDREMRQEIKNEVAQEKQGISLDIVSLEAWFTQSKYIHSLQNAITSAHGCQIDDINYDEEKCSTGFEQLLQVARSIGLNTISELSYNIDKGINRIESFYSNLDYSMRGDAAHFFAVFLIALNINNFIKNDDFPFTDAEYIQAIRLASAATYSEEANK